MPLFDELLVLDRNDMIKQECFDRCYANLEQWHKISDSNIENQGDMNSNTFSTYQQKPPAKTVQELLRPMIDVTTQSGKQKSKTLPLLLKYDQKLNTKREEQQQNKPSLAPSSQQTDNEKNSESTKRHEKRRNTHDLSDNRSRHKDNSSKISSTDSNSKTKFNRGGSRGS